MVLLAFRPAAPADRGGGPIELFAAELGVEEGMLEVTVGVRPGSLGLAAFDFERNGYTSTWTDDDAAALHTTSAPSTAWDSAVADPALAERWEKLQELPAGTLGRRMTEFYRARGFVYPGRPGSAPPLLAQHDWVHLLADFGTTVESELEVFAFIARANDDPRAFSLLAGVVSLFETGYLRTGAGLFESLPGTSPSPGWPPGWPTPCAACALPGKQRLLATGLVRAGPPRHPRRLRALRRPCKVPRRDRCPGRWDREPGGHQPVPGPLRNGSRPAARPTLRRVRCTGSLGTRSH